MALRWYWARPLARDPKAEQPRTHHPPPGRLDQQHDHARSRGHACVDGRAASSRRDDRLRAPRRRGSAGDKTPSPARRFVNAHNLNVSVENRAYAKALRAADYVLPDGIGVKLAARIPRAGPCATTSTAPIFPPPSCSRSTRSRDRVFLLGAEPRGSSTAPRPPSSSASPASRLSACTTATSTNPRRKPRSATTSTTPTQTW